MRYSKPQFLLLGYKQKGRPDGVKYYEKNDQDNGMAHVFERLTNTRVSIIAASSWSRRRGGMGGGTYSLQ